VRTPQQSPHASEQYIYTKGFGKIAICPGFDGTHLLRLLSASGNKDDQESGTFTHILADVKIIKLGHHDVDRSIFSHFFNQ
jgi:hypothetical protein